MPVLHLDNWSATLAAKLKDGGKRTSPIRGIVIHYSTGTKGTPEDVVKELLNHGTSYNYLVQRKPPVAIMLRAPEIRTWHAGGKIPATGPGTSYPYARAPKPYQLPVGAYGKLPNGLTPNSNTIGVSFVAEYGFNKSGSRAARDPYSVKSDWPYPEKGGGAGHWEGFPKDQLEVGARLVAWLLDTHGLRSAPIDSVVFPHGDHPEAAGVANWKPDPGPGFPWRAFLEKVDRYRREGVQAKFDGGGIRRPRILPKP